MLIYSTLSQICVLLPPSVAHPEPEQRQGRKEGCGKTTWFSTFCKIKGCIAPRVHLHRENAQPYLHTAIMTTAINALNHRHCAQHLTMEELCSLQRAVPWTEGAIAEPTP